MRFLLDENVPFELMTALIERGHDVTHVAQSDPQSTDVDVLALAVRTNVVLVTFDSDFGTLVIYRRHAPPDGLVYLQAQPDGAADAVAHLIAALDNGDLILPGHYTVIDQKGSVRVLPLR